MIYNDAEFYDWQYKNYDDDFYFYQQLLNDYGGPVLEIGVGTARLSTQLAKSVDKIVGIDISKEMLAKAREKIDNLGLSKQIQLYQADMQSFELGQQFAGIIMPFNAFAHAYTIKAQDKTLYQIKKHLKTGGVFALDMFNPNFKNLERLKIVAEWQNLTNDESELFVYQSLDKDAQIITSRYYLDRLIDDKVTRKTVTLKQRYYHRFELERALISAGFNNIKFYGDFNKSRYTRSMPRLIAIAH